MEEVADALTDAIVDGLRKATTEADEMEEGLGEARALAGMALVQVTQTKKRFLELCRLYDRMGTMCKLMAKVVSHPIFGKSSASNTLANILDVYMEAGEQLKAVGKGLDALGGEPILEAPDERTT